MPDPADLIERAVALGDAAAVQPVPQVAYEMFGSSILMLRAAQEDLTGPVRADLADLIIHYSDARSQVLTGNAGFWDYFRSELMYVAYKAAQVISFGQLPDVVDPAPSPIPSTDREKVWRSSDVGFEKGLGEGLDWLSDNWEIIAIGAAVIFTLVILVKFR
jgi:hypothetical protein